MKDKYRIDSHKLIFHPGRVAGWLEAGSEWELLKKIYPIYVEVSPVGFCNHRCTFCARDFMGYQNRKIPFDILKTRLSEMAGLGVKSVMFAGEGEPTLYKELPEIIEHCHEVGIDTSLTTNIVPLTEDGMQCFVKYCKWIKVSINGGTAENYAHIHRTGERDFHRAVENMRKCVEFRSKNGYKCTIGAQLLLVPDNSHTVVELAKTMRGTGVDYLVIKPYSHHAESRTAEYKNLDYRASLDLKEQLDKYNTDGFQVIFRVDAQSGDAPGNSKYKTCHSVPFFWAYIMSDGTVSGCSTFLTDDNFNLGNINENSFQQIWEGDRRKKCVDYLKTFDTCNCRENCRMDKINNYLRELVIPDEHVNFI